MGATYQDVTSGEPISSTASLAYVYEGCLSVMSLEGLHPVAAVSRSICVAAYICFVKVAFYFYMKHRAQ
jgi:hypothetical protein